MPSTPPQAPHNTYWLQPGTILAGEYPGAAHPIEAAKKINALLAVGVTAFLDLTETADRLAPYEPLLPQHATTTGVAAVYRRMPIRDMSVPEAPQQMHAILAQLVAWVQGGHCVYVHCWGGVGRTGTVAAGYLVQRAGQSVPAALAHIQQRWDQHMSPSKLKRKPHTPETQQQRNYVLNWASNKTTNTEVTA